MSRYKRQESNVWDWCCQEVSPEEQNNPLLLGMLVEFGLLHQEQQPQALPMTLCSFSFPGTFAYFCTTFLCAESKSDTEVLRFVLIP